MQALSTTLASYTVFLGLLDGGLMPCVSALPAGTGGILVGLFAPVATGFWGSPSLLHALAFDKPNRPISGFPAVMIPVFLAPLAVLWRVDVQSRPVCRQVTSASRQLRRGREA